SYTMTVVDPSKGGATRDAPVSQWWTSWDQVAHDTIQHTDLSWHTTSTGDTGRYADQEAVACGQKDVGSGKGYLCAATGGPQSYPAWIQPAVAAGVDAGLPGAKDAWDTLMQWNGNPRFAESNESNI